MALGKLIKPIFYLGDNMDTYYKEYQIVEAIKNSLSRSYSIVASLEEYGLSVEDVCRVIMSELVKQPPLHFTINLNGLNGNFDGIFNGLGVPQKYFKNNK
jgi:hypothetical protein